MLWSLDQLSNHGLDDANVAIECAADDSPKERDPKVWS